MLFKINITPDQLQQLSNISDEWTTVPTKNFAPEHHRLVYTAIRGLIHTLQNLYKEIEEANTIQELNQFMHRPGVKIDQDQVLAYVSTRGETQPTDESTKEYIRLMDKLESCKITAEPEEPDDPEYLEITSQPNELSNHCLAIHRLAYSTSDPNFKLKLPAADETIGDRILVSLSDDIISVINDLGADKKYKSKLLVGSCITTAVPIINKFDESQPNNFGTTKVKIPPGLQMNMKDVEETTILLTKDDGVTGSRKYFYLLDLADSHGLVPVDAEEADELEESEDSDELE